MGGGQLRRGRVDVLEGRTALREQGPHRATTGGSRGAETREVVALRAVRRALARAHRVLRAGQAVQPRGAHRARVGGGGNLRLRAFDLRLRQQAQRIGRGGRRVARAFAAGLLPGVPQTRGGRCGGYGGIERDARVRVPGVGHAVRGPEGRRICRHQAVRPRRRRPRETRRGGAHGGPRRRGRREEDEW